MSGLNLNASGMLRGLAQMEAKKRAALSVYGETASKKFEAYAKKNYVWNDQTYMASKSLTGTHEMIGNTMRVNISHGVDYGIWLEFANEGKYAILWPTVNACSPQILSGLSNLLK